MFYATFCGLHSLAASYCYEVQHRWLAVSVSLLTVLQQLCTLLMSVSLDHRHRRWVRGGRWARAPPPKIREKYFSGNYYEKWHFSGKNHVKFGTC